MGRIKRVIAFILILILILTLPSISTYAKVDANATGGGLGGANSSASGAASQYKYGYRMYIVNPEGEIVSPVVDMVSDITAVKRCDTAKMTTRIGNGTVKRVIQIPKDLDIPQPYKHTGHAFVGNGTKVRDWVMKKNKAGKQNIMALIHKVFDTEKDTKYVDMFSPTKSDGSYSLILEPVTWHNIYNGPNKGNVTKNSGYGTFYNWMKIYEDKNIRRSTYTSSLDQNVLGNCMVLEKDQLGLSKPTTKPTNHTLTALSNKGYGIHIYSNNAKKETPYTVVAGYITWYGDGDISNYADGGKVETDDIIKAGDRPANIFVADKVGHSMASSDTEENAKKGYELMSWVVTDAKKNDKKLIPIATRNGAVTWYTTLAGEPKASGAKGGVVNLNEKKGKYTIYLLYVRKGKAPDEQTTCDEGIPDKKPHKAPDESDGVYTIVKNYVTNTDGKYTDDGCYIKKETSYNVRIEDEEDVTGYKLVNWAVWVYRRWQGVLAPCLFFNFFIAIIKIVCGV